MNARFKKGQLVYYVSQHFTAAKFPDQRFAGIIVERQIESCGAKFMTFFSRAQHNDFVFGRRQRADAQNYFNRADEALKFLTDEAAKNPNLQIDTRVHSDANDFIMDLANELKIKFNF